MAIEHDIFCRRLWAGSALNFENFVTGPENELAQAAAIHAVDSCAGADNPLVIYGEVGMGKTHLLQAIGNRLLAKNRQSRIGYVHAHNYVSDVVHAYQTSQIDDLRKFYCSLDLVLIDDIQFLSGKLKSQEELFVVINSRLEGNRQIAVTCDVAPEDWVGINPALQSRFGGGLSAAIGQPGVETRFAILRQMSKHEGQPIPDDVAHLIARLVAFNIRDMQGVLKRVWAFSRFHKRPIDLALVKEALQGINID